MVINWYAEVFQMYVSNPDLSLESETGMWYTQLSTWYIVLVIWYLKFKF